MASTLRASRRADHQRFLYQLNIGRILATNHSTADRFPHLADRNPAYSNRNAPSYPNPDFYPSTHTTISYSNADGIGN